MRRPGLASLGEKRRRVFDASGQLWNGLVLFRRCLRSVDFVSVRTGFALGLDFRSVQGAGLPFLSPARFPITPSSDAWKLPLKPGFVCGAPGPNDCQFEVG